MTVPAPAPEQDGAPAQRPSPAQERFARIYHALRDRICLLEYPPGLRLSEEEIAQEFDVSRTPVRRVLARLESEGLVERSEEHTSELQSLMRISYAVFCLKKKTTITTNNSTNYIATVNFIE